MRVKRRCVGKYQQISDDGDKDKKKVVINSLDYDSLAKIFMLLPIPERIDMEKVCVKWKEACQLAWYDTKKYKCESSIGRSYDNRLLTQPYLKEILLRCGKYLKELSLSKVCNSRIMPFVGDHCKNLTILECKFNIKPWKYCVRAFRKLDQLKSLKITVADHKPDKIINISAIIDSLPEEINEIHLFAEPLWGREQKVSMTFKKFKNLKKLTLHGLHLDNIILQEIAEITTLVHLKSESLYVPKCLNKLVNLEYIDLTMGTQYQFAENLTTEILNTIFGTCKNLKHLDIPSGRYDVAKIPLERWINFQNLEYLGISCNIMPDLANTIVEYCKNLKHLRIHNSRMIMNDINDTALKKLTELENLESLILLLYTRLSDKSIIAILNNCKKLKRLEILNRIRVPSIDMEPLASPFVLDKSLQLQCLEHLNLNNVKNLKNSTITAIAKNSKNLRILQIQSCIGITQNGLVALTNLDNLQKLDVSCLDIITDSFLIKLKGLKELICDACYKVTDAGIIQFIKNNPDLEMISVWCINNIKIDMVIAADQATKNRTNGIILHIRTSNESIFRASKSIIKSQWLVVDYF